MIILLWLDSFGILFSFLAHLGLLLGFSIPTNKIAVALNVGIGVVLGARLLITKELRQGKNWILDKRLKNPYWLKVIIGTIITYGIVICIFSLGGMVSKLSVTMTTEDGAIASKKLFIGLFSLIMACYALEFLIVNSYRILKKAELKKFEMDGILSGCQETSNQ